MTETEPAPEPAPARSGAGPGLTRLLVAEAAGTFALVLVGTGAIAWGEIDGRVGHLGICLAFGGVVVAMILALGRVSGAHINPAVTVGFFAARRFEGRLVAPYVAAQLAGALVASAVVNAVFPASVSLGATVPAVGWWPSFALEVGLTFVLMMVILSITSIPRIGLPVIAVAVGATVMLAAFVCGPHTGASMNPARSFGPALISGAVGPLPLYLAAPVLGALLAAPVCRFRGSEACCPAGGTCS